MAANGVKEYSAICSMMCIILCLLCSMPCATTLKTDSHNQSSNNFVSSSLQSFSSGTINADGGTTVKEPSSCDTTLENGPKNKTRNEGQRVSLNCDLSNDDNRPVLWKYFSGSGISRYISKNNQIYSHDGYDQANYKVVINESLQTYKLIIKAATFPTDSGTYQCGYECNSVSFIPLASAVVTISSKFDPSASCQMNLLPSQQSQEESDTFEIICFWSQGYEGYAHFKNAYGEDVQIHLTFPGRIISRIKASNVPNITCQFMFITNSSKTMKAPCTRNERTGILRVDPFITEVTVNSNATFNCSFFNQSYSHSGSWKIHYGESLVRQENLIENKKVISIVNISKSHQSVLVECALNVSDNEKISSFGALRMAKITTPLPDENQIQTTQNRISQTVYEMNKSSTSTYATSMLSEVKTLNITTLQTSTATTLHTGNPQTFDSPTCQINRLPLLGSEFDYEVVCFWNDSQAYHALFERSNGEVLDDYLNFTDHIISRVKFSASEGITCRLSQDSNPSMIISDLCRKDKAPRFVRVDPFIDEVKVGSSASFMCTYNIGGARSKLFSKVHPNGNVSIDYDKQSKEHTNANFAVHRREGGEYLLVECHIQLTGNNMSSYGLLRIIEGTTSLATTFGEGPTSQVTNSQSIQTAESTTGSITGTQPSIKKTTTKLTPPVRDGQTALMTDKSSVQTVRLTTNHNNSYGTNPSFKVTTRKIPTPSPGLQTSQIVDNITTTQPYAPFSRSLVVTDNTSVQTTEYTMDQINTSATNTTPSSTKKGLVVMISISVLVAVVILLLSLIIAYLLRKQKRMSLPRRLSEDDKTDKIELSNIPHILHEESSEWYALSFKDKRVQDMQEQQSNDLIVQHQDESDQNIPMLSSSLGIPSLHLLESIDENVYAEPDVSEEPIRQTISRQQCTFTPLLEDEQ